MKKVLTIAGSDSSGGAGIQADLKTMEAYGIYGMSAITALTAQNTIEVSDVMEVTPGFLERQLDAIFSDIYPDAIKIGMVSNAMLIRLLSANFKKWKVKIPIVIDPVMVSTSGSELLQKDAVKVLKDALLGWGTLLTPNIPEAEILADMTIDSEEDMEKAAHIISDFYDGAVLVKGGHSVNTANDFLYHEKQGSWLYGQRVDNSNTHGTGCTLSSAIACGLALGWDMKTSVSRAKAYLTGALEAGLDLGKGSGPLYHGWRHKMMQNI